MLAINRLYSTVILLILFVQLHVFVGGMYFLFDAANIELGRFANLQSQQ